VTATVVYGRRGKACVNSVHTRRTRAIAWTDPPSPIASPVDFLAGEATQGELQGE